MRDLNPRPLKPVSGRWNPINTHPKDEQWYKCALWGALLEEPLMWKAEENAFCMLDLATRTLIPYKNQPSHWLEIPRIEWPLPPRMVTV